MTDQDAGRDEAASRDEAATPWWHGAAAGLPDIDALLGEEGMEAVGSAADEALKLFVVLRDRFVEAGAQAPATGAEPAAPEPPWATILGQLAATAVKAVNDLASSASQALGPLPGAPPGTGGGRPSPPGSRDDSPGAGAGPAGPGVDVGGETVVLPGQAAACSYCPVCQAIALFRSVPMSTWQRLATSVVEVADAAREFTGSTSQHAHPVVVTPRTAPAASGPASVADVLADLAESAQSDAVASEDAPAAGDAAGDD